MADSQNPRQNVTFPSNGGEAHGYLATPSGGSGPGVILIQEWWGLDDHIVGVADRMAGEGFTVLAPDLYGGKVAHDSGDAEKFMNELPAEQAARDLGGAVDYLLGRDETSSSTVGVVGFCMGGGFVLMMATQQGDRVSAAVPFYGVGHLPDDFSSLTADVQGHYGERDDFYPVDQARQLEDKLKAESKGSVEFFYYDAGHAFHNDMDKMGTYSPDDAAKAWERAHTFLRSHIK